MTLASSGSLSMGGSAANRSINVELGNAATDQISLNDTDVRTLGGASSGTIAISDFYGASAGGGGVSNPLGIGITYTANSDTYTDTVIPATPSTVSNSNSQITGTTWWRRVRLTVPSAGSYAVHIRGQRDGNATSYRGDAQIAAIDFNGQLETLDTTGGIQSGWRTVDRQSSTITSMPTTNYAATSGGSNGRFVLKVSNTVTSSSLTGRLSNIAANYNGASNLGYGYFETSGGSVSNANYHALSPTKTGLSQGDYVDIYYGVDCASLQLLQFTLV